VTRGFGASLVLRCLARRCAPGRFQPRPAESSCQLASAGSFVPEAGASNETVCPAGSFSSTGQSECTLCSPPTFTDKAGQASCQLAPSGTFVGTDGATSAEACPFGQFSAAAATSCEPCPVGTYTNASGAGECRLCPTPTTTTRTGALFCDACQRGHYWDTVYFERRGRAELLEEGTQCVRCCVDCDDSDGFECDEAGIRLESIPVKRNYWRATSLSTKAYECDLSAACRGGNDTRTSRMCRRGNTGALCGSCRALGALETTNLEDVLLLFSTTTDDGVNPVA